MFITPTTQSDSQRSVPGRRWWLVLVMVCALVLAVVVIWLRQRGPEHGTERTVIPPPMERTDSQSGPRKEAPLPATGYPQDADRDGVSDEVERQKGTDPQLGDSDSDGYGDYEEIFLLKTDPLRADPLRAHPATTAPGGGM